tara:strand:+ start:2075 stop:2926 length:852 start_codon:yes stop_codon:yes gene_type:complete
MTRERRTTRDDKYGCIACGQEFLDIKGAVFHSHTYKHITVHKEKGFETIRDADVSEYARHGDEVKWIVSKITGENVLRYGKKHPYVKAMQRRTVKKCKCDVCSLPFVIIPPTQIQRFCSPECKKEGRYLPVKHPEKGVSRRSTCQGFVKSGKRCTRQAQEGEIYCGFHIPKGKLHSKSRAGYKRRRAFYDRYFQQALMRIADDSPQMTLSDILTFIQWRCEQEENFIISRQTLLNWYKDYKVPQGYPPVRKSKQPPFIVVLGWEREEKEKKEASTSQKRSDKK